MPSSLQYPLERHREVQRFRMPVEPEAPPWFTLVAVSPIITITDWNGTFRAPFLALSDGPETEYVSARFKQLLVQALPENRRRTEVSATSNWQLWCRR
jgi:hypothetical protein